MWPEAKPPPNERAIDDRLWLLSAPISMSPPAVSFELSATVAVVGESPRSTDDSALPTSMTPPPAVSAVATTSKDEKAWSSMSVPAVIVPARVASSLGDPVIVAFGNENAPIPPRPPWAVDDDDPLPGVGVIVDSDAPDGARRRCPDPAGGEARLAKTAWSGAGRTTRTSVPAYVMSTGVPFFVRESLKLLAELWTTK